MLKAHYNIKLIEVKPSEVDKADLYMTLRDLRHLTNALIDSGDTYIEHGIKVIQNINAQVDGDLVITVCSLCAKKIGIKRCAACPRDNGIRYCSRRCQLAHWPQHKAVCGGRLNEK